MTRKPHFDAVLLLEDGTVFKGKAAGLKGIGTGEICFNTGMTGYQEIFTDPSYFGQILVATNAHIGNYGVKDSEVESDQIQISGLVCKNFTDQYSRQMADQNIQAYFEENKIVCIHQVDSRAIVRHIRDKGAMNCLISTDELDVEVLREKCKEIPSMAGLELASKVSTKDTYTVGEPDADIKIAVLDYGVKRNILQCFADRGAFLKVFPAKTVMSELNTFEADGYFLSNGPGDPASMDYAIALIKELMQTGKPIFGICLGHQLLALANDIPTYKMHNGHRGINHPVKNLITGKCEITSQNHGFGVSPEAIENSDLVEVTHRNLNDDTVEGIKVKGTDAYSVQYHPESSPGPHDSRYLFDEFINTIKTSKKG
ncbi:MAG: glutamine-hydrolyzing carbamoyl-phosphate synthase small subunit [Saprospiraceae bacterium]|nr:glutamine-hydrolyzing carbamoyl-phosphate synthase small subunit [Saprospiraceae bacterium]